SGTLSSAVSIRILTSERSLTSRQRLSPSRPGIMLSRTSPPGQPLSTQFSAWPASFAVVISNPLKDRPRRKASSRRASSSTRSTRGLLLLSFSAAASLTIGSVGLAFIVWYGSPALPQASHRAAMRATPLQRTSPLCILRRRRPPDLRQRRLQLVDHCRRRRIDPVKQCRVRRRKIAQQCER